MNFRQRWLVQLWCYPYRSYDAGKWSADWPFLAFNPRFADEEARANAIVGARRD